MPRGNGQQGTTCYWVRIDVPRRGGWRAWGTVRADFGRPLADPAITPAEIASEHRRGPDYVRVTVALAVAAADVADALAIAWDAFGDIAADDLASWEVTAAAAEVRPEPPLPEDGASALSGALPSPITGQNPSAWGTRSSIFMCIVPVLCKLLAAQRQLPAMTSTDSSPFTVRSVGSGSGQKRSRHNR